LYVFIANIRQKIRIIQPHVIVGIVTITPSDHEKLKVDISPAMLAPDRFIVNQEDNKNLLPIT